MNTKAELYTILLNADENTTIFIDECQALSSKAQHLLLTAISEKTDPASDDELIIEDSEDSNNKKSVKIDNLWVKHMRLQVRNETGSTIAAYKVVYVSGFNNIPLVALTDNTDGSKLEVQLGN